MMMMMTMTNPHWTRSLTWLTRNGWRRWRSQIVSFGILLLDDVDKYHRHAITCSLRPLHIRHIREKTKLSFDSQKPEANIATTHITNQPIFRKKEDCSRQNKVDLEVCKNHSSIELHQGSLCMLIHNTIVTTSFDSSHDSAPTRWILIGLTLQGMNICVHGYYRYIVTIFTI